ncbi:MAG: hypothetical protein WBY44_06750 [Bryobacteraceae bacterium]
MVNPVRKAGEWNVYDIVFEAPKFEGDKLVKPAFVTLFFNGVMAHNRKELNGSTEHRVLGTYKPHGDEPSCCRIMETRCATATSGCGPSPAMDQPDK